MEQERNRLQELTNLLNARNRGVVNSYSRHSRFKVTDKYAIGANRSERIKVEDRISILPDLLLYQYQQRVAMRRMEYKGIDQHAYSVVCKYLTDVTSKSSLLLMGTTGTGKTTMMLSVYDVLQALYREEIADNEVSFYYTKASEIGGIMKTNEQNFKRLKQSMVLFVDDLGFNGESEVVNDYGVKRKPIEDIIEYRYDKQLATIFTTNLNEDMIKDTYGKRVHSRMREEFLFLPMTGIDYRIN